MGDDLKESGEFITFAMAQMDVLLSELRLDAERAHPILSAISQKAKAVNARGIFLAGQRAIDSYENSYSQPKIDGRLMSLYKLVVQYHSGWQEIVPDALGEALEIAAPKPAAKASAAPSSKTTTKKTATKSTRRDPVVIEQNYQNAKTMLTELMPFAGLEHGALGALMGLDITLAGSPEDIMTDTMENLTEEPIKDTPTLMSDFETLMPDLINEALRFARVQGKSVSLSYAADDLQLSAVELTSTYIRLEDIITDFISRKIASPSQRAQQGLARGGHIDISVLQNGANTKLSVTCEGEKKEIELRKPVAPRPQSAPLQQPPMELAT